MTLFGALTNLSFSSSSMKNKNNPFTNTRNSTIDFGKNSTAASKKTAKANDDDSDDTGIILGF